MDLELERIFNDFLEIIWVNSSLGENRFKSYRKFYEEFSKSGLLYIHMRYFFLKECKVGEFDGIDFEEIPPCWIVPTKDINGRLFGSAKDYYYEFVLKKEEDTWKIKNISSIPKSPEKIEPLPNDIERDLRIISEQSSTYYSKEDYLLINGIELFDNRIFINTRMYLFMIDMDSENVSKYENYLPIDYSYGVGINFEDNLKRYKVSFVNFDDEEIIWEKEFNENPLFFLSFDDESLYFL